MKKLILIVLLLGIKSYSQENYEVTGNVTYNGKTKENVTVLINNLDSKIKTDNLGNYGIKDLAQGTYNFSFQIDLLKKDTVITLFDDKNIILDIILKEDIKEALLNKRNKNELSEVTVFGKKEKKYVVSTVSESLRINTPLIETPQNITVATQQTIRDFGITGTAQMARLTSGLIKNYGNNNDFSFSIRGTDATNNIFRNGVGSYWWNQQADAFMIDKVEFIKGPAGFMIGNSEPGGIVNEVTKQADGTKIIEVMTGGGSFNLYRLGFDIGNTFTEKSKFSYRIVLGGQTTGSNIDFYNSKRVYATPSIRYNYNKDSHIQVEMNLMDGKSKLDSNSNVSLDGKSFLFSKNFNSGDPNLVDGIQTDDLLTKISHKHKFKNEWSLKTQITEVHGKYDGDSMYDALFSENFDTIYRQYSVIKWKNGLTSIQSFLDGKFHTGKRIEHSILSGFDYGNTWVNSVFGEAGTEDDWGTNLPLVVSNPIYNLNKNEIGDINNFPRSRYGTKWTSFYTQDHIKIYDKFMVTLAGRYSYTESYSEEDNETTTVYDTKFTPRLGLTYLITKYMSLYTLYDETFLPQTGRKQDGTAPKPLSGTNLEFGYKAELNKKININASLFFTNKNNVLVKNPQNDFYEERGEIVSKGFEFGTIGTISKSILLNLNYTYTDAKITKDIDEAIIGFPNYGVANYVANAMIRYKVINGNFKNISFGLGSQYTSERSAVFAGWTEAIDKDKKLPSYVLMDANIAYEINKFTIGFNAYNLLNRTYFDTGFWNSPSDTTAGFYTGSLGNPSNFILSINYKI